jgi:hypothetical protein
MSTKINVRSPFYLNLQEPTFVAPTFICDTAGLTNLTIDQQGQISTPSLAYGVVDSITSTASDFSNGKFATVSTATTRTLTVRIIIPDGYANVDEVYIDCEYDITQPAYVTGGSTPSCSAGPTNNGSIPAVTLDSGGDSDTVNLSSYFTQGNVSIAGYNTSVAQPNLVNVSISSNTLTISSNSFGGSTTVYVSAYDNETNSCTATQSISVTVNAPSGTNFACTNNGIEALNGGSIAQDGTITKPTGVGVVGTIKDTSGGSAITSYSANNTGSNRTVTLYFDVTAPNGYTNAGSTIECSKSFVQPSSLPEFTCEIANLYGQQITSKGSIVKGSATIGTLGTFSPDTFAEVSTETSRSVTFKVTPPATGYSNSGGADIDCTKTITQPATTPSCGSTDFHLSVGLSAPSNFCGGSYDLRTLVSSTGGTYGLGARVCKGGTPFDGADRYYAVGTSPLTIGLNYGKFLIWQIDSNGIIQTITEWNCGSGTPGTGGGGQL